MAANTAEAMQIRIRTQIELGLGCDAARNETTRHARARLLYVYSSTVVQIQVVHNLRGTPWTRLRSAARQQTTLELAFDASCVQHAVWVVHVAKARVHPPTSDAF
mgnify:CR=1 FL=1